MSFKKLFETSIKHGRIGDNKQRTEEYVVDKIAEEFGELTLEKQIKNGMSYKEAGVDGVPGEAVDLTISAIDMFCLQFPDMEAHEIMEKFEEIMANKLKKWDKVHNMWRNSNGIDPID